MSTRKPDDFDRLIAKLYKQGILVGGKGPPEIPGPFSQITGFLKRFLKRRDRS